MDTAILSVGLDLLVVSCLAATIFYVIKLTQSLSHFKAHRREFDTVITNLMSSIDQAERTVQKLKNTTAQEGGDLDALIVQSKAMADELRIINDASESMAVRLEKLAEKNSRLVKSRDALHSDMRRDHALVKPAPMKTRDTQPPQKPPEKKPAPRANPAAASYADTLKKADRGDDAIQDFPSFMIKDREFSDVKKLGQTLDSSVSNDAAPSEYDDVIPENLQSQAEKDLLAALRSAKRNISQGGRE